MTDERPRHPSKRPIRAQKPVGRGYYNTPLSGPVTPRLQQPVLKDAIGFYHPTLRRDEEDE